MRSSNVNMLSGSITKGLLSLTIPIMVMNVLQSIFNIIDMTTLKLFSNEKAVGAVGACGILITLCTGLLIGIATGANVVVARRVGAKDTVRAEKAVTTAISFSIIGGFVLMLIGVIFAENFLVMTNCPDTLLPQAVKYFKIYFLGVPIFMFYNFCASILRAIGDTKSPMCYLIFGGVLKVILTIFFVVCFSMDVGGVAVATIVSNAIASGLAFLKLLKYQNVVRINLHNIKIDLTELKDMLRIGIPTGLQSSLYSLANVVITTTVNGFGEAATTGISIANQFDGILYQISFAPSLAVTPYVAQNMGAGNIIRIKKAFSRALLITTVFGATFGMLSAIFSKELSSIMSSNPDVIEFSQQKMFIISTTYFICGINDVIGGMLRGMGKPIMPTVSTMVYMCLLRFVWVYAIFPLFPNLTFLYTVWPIGWTLSIITLLIPYFITIKSLTKIANHIRDTR